MTRAWQVYAFNMINYLRVYKSSFWKFITQISEILKLPVTKTGPFFSRNCLNLKAENLILIKKIKFII